MDDYMDNDPTYGGIFGVEDLATRNPVKQGPTNRAILRFHELRQKLPLKDIAGYCSSSGVGYWGAQTILRDLRLEKILAKPLYISASSFVKVEGDEETEDRTLYHKKIGQSHGDEEDGPTFQDDSDAESDVGGGEGGTRQRHGPKRITADLDHEDTLILTMKESGYSDKQVADELAHIGKGVKYDRKAISSRFNRLKAALAARTDDQLKYGFKEWSAEEDAALTKAWDDADKQIDDEIAKVYLKRYRYMAEHLNREKGTRFSANAVQERWGNIMAGEARIPPELDDDPAYREQLRGATMLLHILKMESDALADRELKEAERKAEDRQRKLRAYRLRDQFERNTRKAAEQLERANEKAAKLREKHERLQAKNETQKAKILGYEQGIAAVQSAKKRKAIALGLAEDDTQPPTPPKKKGLENLSHADQIEIAQWAAAKPTRTSTKKSVNYHENGASSPGSGGDGEDANYENGDASDEGEGDIRERLNVQELSAICKERGINSSGLKSKIIVRLAADDARKTNAALREILKKRHLSTHGAKDVLINRLKTADVHEYCTDEARKASLNAPRSGRGETGRGKTPSSNYSTPTKTPTSRGRKASRSVLALDDLDDEEALVEEDEVVTPTRRRDMPPPAYPASARRRNAFVASDDEEEE